MSDMMCSMCSQGKRTNLVLLVLLSLLGSYSCRPGRTGAREDQVNALTEEVERVESEDEKSLLTGVKNDLTNYIQNTDLLSTDSYQFYLALPDKLTLGDFNVSFDGGSTSFNKGTLGNLALIGAAGFLLSFLPKEAIGNLFEAGPSVAVQDNPIPNLEDYGLFQNPYDASNNPVAGINNVLPLNRNDDVPGESDVDLNIPGKIVAKNNKKGDWNRMDSEVGYEVDLQTSGAANQLVYAAHQPNRRHYPAPGQVAYAAPYRNQVAYAPNQVAYAPNQLAHAASELSQVAYPEPEPNPDREPRQKEDAEDDTGFFKNLEQKISNFFLESPVARISEEIGLSTVLNRISDFWNENFSWTSGKFSPKNILQQEDDVESREDRLLDDPEEELKREESELQVQAIRVVPTPLMTDMLLPPPPPELHLLR